MVRNKQRGGKWVAYGMKTMRILFKGEYIAESCMKNDGFYGERVLWNLVVLF